MADKTTSATIQVSPNLEKTLEGLKPGPMMQTIAKGLDRATQLITGQIMAQRLTGKGPFPVAAHRLGVRTGRLRQSTRATRAKVEGMKATSAIGSRVRYAAVHEFGDSGTAKVKAHKRKVKKVFGRVLKAPLVQDVKAHQRKYSFPARSPFQTGISENLPMIENEIVREVTDSVQRSAGGNS